MHRHSKIWVIFTLIGSLILAPALPVAAAAMAAKQDVAPMHAMHQKSDSSQKQLGCKDLTCVSHQACASQCKVSCSATLGIFDHTFSVRNATVSAPPVRAVYSHTPITLASNDRPPIFFG